MLLKIASLKSAQRGGAMMIALVLIVVFAVVGIASYKLSGNRLFKSEQFAGRKKMEYEIDQALQTQKSRFLRYFDSHISTQTGTLAFNDLTFRQDFFQAALNSLADPDGNQNTPVNASDRALWAWTFLTKMEDVITVPAMRPQGWATWKDAFLTAMKPNGTQWNAMVGDAQSKFKLTMEGRGASVSVFPPQMTLEYRYQLQLQRDQGIDTPIADDEGIISIEIKPEPFTKWASFRMTMLGQGGSATWLTGKTVNSNGDTILPASVYNGPVYVADLPAIRGDVQFLEGIKSSCAHASFSPTGAQRSCKPADAAAGLSPYMIATGHRGTMDGCYDPKNPCKNEAAADVHKGEALCAGVKCEDACKRTTDDGPVTCNAEAYDPYYEPIIPPQNLFNTLRLAAGDQNVSLLPSTDAVDEVELKNLLVNHANKANQNFSTASAVPAGAFIPTDSFGKVTGGIVIHKANVEKMTIDSGSTTTSDFFSTLPSAHRDAAKNYLNSQAPGCEFQKVSVTIDPAAGAAYPHMETYLPIPGGSCAPSALNKTIVFYPQGATLVKASVPGRTNGVVVVDQGKIDSFGGGNANRAAVKNSKMGVFAEGEIRVDRHVTYASAKFVKIDDMGNPVGASIDANGNISGTSYTVDQFQNPPTGLDRNNVRPVIHSESQEVFGLYSQNGNITVKNVFQTNGTANPNDDVLDTNASAPASLDFHGSVFSTGANCRRGPRTYYKCNEDEDEFNDKDNLETKPGYLGDPGCGFGVEQFNNKRLGNRGRLKLLGSNIMNRSGATGSPNCSDAVDGQMMAGFQGQWNFDRRLGLGLVSVPGYPVSNVVAAQIRVIPIRNWRMADQAH